MQNNSKIVIGLLILVIILLGLGVYLLFTRTIPNQALNTPSDTQVRSVSTRPETGLDLHNQYAQQYGALFVVEFNKPPNFNDVFRIVQIKCAETECYDLYALHKITGETYKVAEGVAGYTISENKIFVGWSSGIDDTILYNETTNTFEFQPSDNTYGI